MRFETIAFVQSPFKQKFAIPRQPNLVSEARGSLRFTQGYCDDDLLRRLDEFSHLWLIFEFHATASQGWTPTVQPPRLGGKERVGVFASRSPFRPNSLGLSVVENLGSRWEDRQLFLDVGGIDLLDGTPILDIKPYVPYADALPHARGGYAQEQPARAHQVRFSEDAGRALLTEEERHPGLEALIRALLSQDPRPAWRVKEEDDKQYGMALYDLNIKWHIRGDVVTVGAIHRLEARSQPQP
jgi:tRNA-Thr(GGU) m(6)t(6)A37 methyltransferase TsaA